MALVLWVSGVLVLGTFREGGWSLGDQVWMSSSFVFLYLLGDAFISNEQCLWSPVGRYCVLAQIDGGLRRHILPHEMFNGDSIK